MFVDQGGYMYTCIYQIPMVYLCIVHGPASYSWNCECNLTLILDSGILVAHLGESSSFQSLFRICHFVQKIAKNALVRLIHDFFFRLGLIRIISYKDLWRNCEKEFCEIKKVFWIGLWSDGLNEDQGFPVRLLD